MIQSLKRPSRGDTREAPGRGGCCWADSGTGQGEQTWWVRGRGGTGDSMSEGEGGIWLGFRMQEGSGKLEDLGS